MKRKELSKKMTRAKNFALFDSAQLNRKGDQILDKIEINNICYNANEVNICCINQYSVKSKGTF